ALLSRDTAEKERRNDARSPTAQPALLSRDRAETNAGSAGDRKPCASDGRRRAPWRMAAVPSPLTLFSLRLAEAGDFDAYMDAFEAVAADGRWMGAEAPLDRD